MTFPSSLTVEPNRKTNKQIRTPTLMEIDKEASGMVPSREELIDWKKRKGKRESGNMVRAFQNSFQNRKEWIPNLNCLVSKR